MNALTAASPARAPRRRLRNSPQQYDDLAEEWWKPEGAFAALHWLATARGRLIPPVTSPAAVLLDLGCGGGLLAPTVDGYHHVGIDMVQSALAIARSHGVTGVRGDVRRLPFRDESADVVVAGELFEHLTDVETTIAEIVRVMRPGAVVVLDTINDTRWARLSLVTVGERLPGGPPPKIHDPALFIAPRRLVELFAQHGVQVRCHGLRPSVVDYARFLRGRSSSVRMLPTRSTAAVYQGLGTKPR